MSSLPAESASLRRLLRSHRGSVPARFLATALVASFALIAAQQPADAGAAVVTIVNQDGPGEGFNDPTPAIPRGGNSGNTLGEQRLIAAQFAADIWASILESNVEVLVNAEMNPLDCSLTAATLGSAGATSVFRDFPGALLPATFYPSALADKLHGSDLEPGAGDINARFNSSIGTTCPFPRGWYYGTDGNANDSVELDFVSVFLHELGHGLGFVPFVNVNTGKRLANRNDAFSVNLEDHDSAKTWGEMSDGERAASATNTGKLHWIGARVLDAKDILTAGKSGGHVRMYAPATPAPGSTAGHFDTSLNPDELMEPAYTGVDHDPSLTVAALADAGWGAPTTCGDGVKDIGEICDDGNRQDGDCCSADCSFEVDGSPCQDSNICTDDFCDGAGTCVSTANSAPCDDGDACTVGDQCAAASCTSGAPRDCDDSDDCTADACDTLSGCTHTEIPGCGPTTTTLPPSIVCGDFTGDGEVKSSDALGVLQAAVSHSACDLRICDADGNAKVSASDALGVLRHAVDPEFPLHCPES